MEEILDKYQKLNKTQQQLLLTYADNLLLQQQLEHGKGDLSEWKKKILNVSVWSEEEIEQMQTNAKLLGQWKVPKW